MVAITEKAAKRIQELLTEDKKAFLRVGVTGGGCSGFQYALVLEEVREPNDELVTCRGLGILIDPVSKSYIQGSEIDFDDIKGFIVKNPNAKSTCGCGQSFEADPSKK
ncbi:MAG: hypothetical protein A3J46_04770 [Candidatus Yanofskybacteria bacterium RIFCSPHIGHO2_02_FULL_41_11]|uniref:Core domain-containing protein n=1 Tax=Candidatus Yanofskybacteria bacterium RIFCSPHIGHO2_02_FULL_41_11 TaxID=1802675 RepID=A0A1F8FAP2_9BACT|nr:MAG: hypothetical protein A3J46_04770 [Candidatus Yanofskybacteria bacterium RIFCSPHIGHO2_02_FULL_41_11]